MVKSPLPISSNGTRRTCTVLKFQAWSTNPLKTHLATSSCISYRFDLVYCYFIYCTALERFCLNEVALLLSVQVILNFVIPGSDTARTCQHAIGFSLVYVTSSFHLIIFASDLRNLISFRLQSVPGANLHHSHPLAGHSSCLLSPCKWEIQAEHVQYYPQLDRGGLFTNPRQKASVQSVRLTYG